MRKSISLSAALLLLAATQLPAGATCKVSKVVSLDLTLDHNQMLVSGSVNDHDVRFVIDTGTDSAVYPQTASAFGVYTGGAAAHNYDAIGEHMAAPRATIEKLALGPWVNRNVVLSTTGTAPSDPKIVGSLGEDILRHFDVEIDVKNHVFALYQTEGCGDANLAFWSDSYNSVDFTGFDVRHPAITFKGKIGESPVLIQLDTGIAHTMVSTEAARAFGVGPDSAGAQNIGQINGLDGQPETAWAANFTSFALDAEVIKPARLGFFKFSRGPAADGTSLTGPVAKAEMVLGMDFVASHHLLISHSQQKVYFTYSGGKPFF